MPLMTQNDPYANKPEGEVPWFNAKNVSEPEIKPQSEPKIDKEVSKIVGKEILVNDPRLIKLVNHWRESGHPDKFDNHLQSKAKREDLKRTFKDYK